MISSFGRPNGTLKSMGNQTGNGFTLSTLHKAQSFGDGDDTPEPIEEKVQDEEEEQSMPAHLRQNSVDRQISVMSPARSTYSPQRTLLEGQLNESITKIRTSPDISGPLRRLDFNHKQSKEAARAFFKAYEFLTPEQQSSVFTGLTRILKEQGKTMFMSPGKRSAIHSVLELPH